MMDNDDAGNKGKAKLKNLYSSYCNLLTMGVPRPYKDIDSFFKHDSSGLAIKVKDTLALPFDKLKANLKKGENG